MLSRIFEEDVQKRKNASSQEPPSKRVKIYTNNEDIDDDEYEEALRKLKEYGKHQKGSNHKDKTSNGADKIETPCLDKRRLALNRGSY